MRVSRNARVATLVLAAGGLCAACAYYPTGPSVMVLPGRSASFEQFQQDDSQCRGWASQSSGAAPRNAATETGVAAAAVGTAIGAASGAAIGAAAGNPAAGAAIGAGSGLLVGSAVGAERGNHAGRTAQHRYDNTYLQCMYAKGHQIPMPRSALQRSEPPTRPQASAKRVPPPPRGAPPPPPPGVD